MAIEERRGCGYRKVGGLYIMGGKLSAPCCKMPITLETCPTCAGGVRLTRTWAWVNPRPWFKGKCVQPWACPGGNPEAFGDEVGLLNIGAQFYPTPESFTLEAAKQGISRRIQALPRGFQIGETWVLLAHPRLTQIDAAYWVVKGEKGKVLTKRRTQADAQGYVNYHGAGSVEQVFKKEWVGGVFAFFKPTAVEKLVTATQARDEEAMAKLAKAGITAVVVPDGDKDHQGSVYDEAAA